MNYDEYEDTLTPAERRLFRAMAGTTYPTARSRARHGGHGFQVADRIVRASGGAITRDLLLGDRATRMHKTIDRAAKAHMRRASREDKKALERRSGQVPLSLAA